MSVADLHPPHICSPLGGPGAGQTGALGLSRPDVSRKAGQRCAPSPGSQAHHTHLPLKTHLQVRLSPRLPWILPALPTGPLVSLCNGSLPLMPQPHLLGPVLTAAASDTPKGLRAQAPPPAGSPPQSSPPQPLLLCQASLWAATAPVVCLLLGTQSEAASDSTHRTPPRRAPGAPWVLTGITEWVSTLRCPPGQDGRLMDRPPHSAPALPQCSA